MLKRIGDHLIIATVDETIEQVTWWSIRRAIAKRKVHDHPEGNKGGKMNGTELNSIRRVLLIQKSRILNKAVEFRSQEMSDNEWTADEADKVSTDLSLSVSLHLQERDRSALLQIEKALGKIHDGTYGQCECCREAIGVRRLRARPFAALCIACMEEQEELQSPPN